MWSLYLKKIFQLALKSSIVADVANKLSFYSLLLNWFTSVFRAERNQFLYQSFIWAPPSTKAERAQTHICSNVFWSRLLWRNMRMERIWQTNTDRSRDSTSGPSYCVPAALATVPLPCPNEGNRRNICDDNTIQLLYLSQETVTLVFKTWIWCTGSSFEE